MDRGQGCEVRHPVGKEIAMPRRIAFVDLEDKQEKKMSQGEQILMMLRVAPVRNHTFPKVGILNYTARISELKKKGYIIKCRNIPDKDGNKSGTNEYVLAKPRSPHHGGD